MFFALLYLFIFRLCMHINSVISCNWVNMWSYSSDIHSTDPPTHPVPPRLRFILPVPGVEPEPRWARSHAKKSRTLPWNWAKKEIWNQGCEAKSAKVKITTSDLPLLLNKSHIFFFLLQKKIGIGLELAKKKKKPPHLQQFLCRC